jgi:hypothetical protein
MDGLQIFFLYVPVLKEVKSSLVEGDASLARSLRKLSVLLLWTSEATDDGRTDVVPCSLTVHGSSVFIFLRRIPVPADDASARDVVAGEVNPGLEAVEDSGNYISDISQTFRADGLKTVR